MGAFIKKNGLKLIGGLFIFFAVLIALFFRCPTNVQYLIIYTLIGVGIALILPRSAEKASADTATKGIKIKLIGGVSLPFILFFINPIRFFKPDDCDLKLKNTSITVFVHGKKGRQDMILRQKGVVMMDVGAERKRASINENGQAFFQNLHIGDNVRLEIDFSESYKAIYPDSTYIISSDSAIYLPASLQGIDKVPGMVLFQDAPLANVIVKIQNAKGILLDTTNQTGDFNFDIPEYMQTKEYEVWFMKDGFKSKSALATPQTGQSLTIIMEKQ